MGIVFLAVRYCTTPHTHILSIVLLTLSLPLLFLSVFSHTHTHTHTHTPHFIFTPPPLVLPAHIPFRFLPSISIDLPPSTPPPIPSSHTYIPLHPIPLPPLPPTIPSSSPGSFVDGGIVWSLDLNLLTRLEEPKSVPHPL